MEMQLLLKYLYIMYFNLLLQWIKVHVLEETEFCNTAHSNVPKHTVIRRINGHE